MTEYLSNHGLLGIVIGLSTFLIIGIFHPLVIKGEYYLGQRSNWIFLLMGIATLIGSIMVCDIFWSSILGVTGFSSFWSILEVKEQEKRVQKGWFPRNPKRKYPWD
jgi:hypothetical protein